MNDAPHDCLHTQLVQIIWHTENTQRHACCARHDVAWGQAIRRGGSVTPRLWPIFDVVVLWADVPFQEPAQGPSHGSSSCRKDPTPIERRDRKLESEKFPNRRLPWGEAAR